MAKDAAYREAEMRIEQAWESGAVEINLDDLGLTELPESLGLLQKLKILDLKDNELTELPESLGQLQQLKKLDLHGNYLTELPESIGQLQQLQELDLEGMWLTELPEYFGQLKQLQTLNLHDNQLRGLPKSLGQLEHLQILYLGHNRLTELPENLSQLQRLRKLYLHNNLLIELPKFLGQFEQLQKLTIFNNQLTKLPESLGQFDQLLDLDLGGNQLTELPESLGQIQQLQTLHLAQNQLTELPKTLGQLEQLEVLDLRSNQLTELPGPLGHLQQLELLILHENQLTELPESIGLLQQLQRLSLNNNYLAKLPESLGQLQQLQMLSLNNNQLTELPESLGQLQQLQKLHLNNNQLETGLAAAYAQGLDAVKAYLRAKKQSSTNLHEAKLILVGEGEVGKTCLMAALRGLPWQERESTHGIEIGQVDVVDESTETEIRLNGWDFGGQKVYKPTHQLFFSAPAVYLVVWKPREGMQAGQVKEWIKLIKHREPDAKILVVATHGRERQADIDRYDLRREFGEETIMGFYHVDSKPDEDGNRVSIDELRTAIAGVAMQLPEMGKTVPTKWQNIREELSDLPESWMRYDEFVQFCTEREMEEEQVELFAKISHRLGNIIHYDYDPTLRDIVILKPDWLAKAISFVLDDKETRDKQGLVSFDRLSQLWNDPKRDSAARYPAELHPAFLRLMERFHLSYEVQYPQPDAPQTILIGQLVPDIRPDVLPDWEEIPNANESEQVQICRILDERDQSETAEGLFYQLIVRLHKHSLGREDFDQSVHWQRGLMLDGKYNGRALLEHIGSDIKITVRAAMPDRFLTMLTEEVKYLIESFWEGLRCQITVPCAEPCGKTPGTELFEVETLITLKQDGESQFRCLKSGCGKKQDIEYLLRYTSGSANGVVSQADLEKLIHDLTHVVRAELKTKDQKDLHRFRHLQEATQKMMSQADMHYSRFMQALTDEAKEGPRLFSFEPVDTGFFDRPNWVAEQFQLTLWCEHSQLPLTELNEPGDTRGSYKIELTRDWVRQAAPYLKALSTTLSLVLPVASSATQLLMDDSAYDRVAKQLDFGQRCASSLLQGGDEVGSWLGEGDDFEKKHRGSSRGDRGGIRAEAGMLRELQHMLKQKDPSFGDLVRVSDNQGRFLWVHEQFVGEY